MAVLPMLWLGLSKRLAELSLSTYMSAIHVAPTLYVQQSGRSLVQTLRQGAGRIRVSAGEYCANGTHLLAMRLNRVAERRFHSEGHCVP